VSAEPRSAVVFGARNLGRGVAAHLIADGWNVAAAARSDATIKALTEQEPRVLASAVDLGEPGAAAGVLEGARNSFGRIDLVVNAIADPQVSAAALSRERDEGAHLESTIGAAVAPVHLVADATLRLLRDQKHGCFIQITGGLALRAQPGTGPLAATGYATRALIEGAVPEAREDGVHVALLVIRGMIESPLTAESLRGLPQGASMTEEDVTAAIDLLVAQGRGRAWTHELVLTPPEARWQG
jgi:NAD(P)-dependent dehydrogenase (short-subunit alcohol dehydrogenase family)